VKGLHAILARLTDPQVRRKEKEAMAAKKKAKKKKAKKKAKRKSR